ncbi:MAG TPA: cytochrome c-type biogenesis protein CcmH [Actinomycetota bacterium]|nr:cytochrome c-type biogenesis protein CcmH [Actinomycetota bacterium]
MSGRGRLWLALAAAVVVVALAAVFAPGGRGGDTPDERVRDIASGLRCPVCQNLSVADSPSRLAGEMRSEIESQLEAGRTPDEVRAFFVERYGEWVLLAPTREGLNLLPWLVPVVGVVLGVGLWVYLLRRRPAREELA